MMTQKNGISLRGKMTEDRSSGTSFNEAQMVTVQEIVSNYDPENMTPESKFAMRDELEAAGIAPSGNLKSFLKGYGFGDGLPNARGVERTEGWPSSESRLDSEDFDALLDKYEKGTITDEEVDRLVELLSRQGESRSGTVVDENI